LAERLLLDAVLVFVAFARAAFVGAAFARGAPVVIAFDETGLDIVVISRGRNGEGALRGGLSNAWSEQDEA
jgi:hypothetical protein